MLLLSTADATGKLYFSGNYYASPLRENQFTKQVSLFKHDTTSYFDLKFHNYSASSIILSPL